MRPSAFLTRFLGACISVLILLAPLFFLQPVKSYSLSQDTTKASPLASQSTVKRIPKASKKVAPKAPGGLHALVLGAPIWDNGNFDGVNGLASEINTAVSDARTADDFMLTSTTTISYVTAQMLTDVTPPAAQVEIYADYNMASPSNGPPLATYTFSSANQIGSGFGYPLIEFTFNTTGLTLTPGKYWVCPIVIGNGSGRGFFATTGSGTIKLESGYFKGSYFGYGYWGINLYSDFAFKVYSGEQAGVDHATIYAADTMNHRIERSTNDGVTWQMVGYGPGLTVGKFNTPRGVTSSANDKIIFVADTLNNRIQRSTDSGITWQVIAGPGLNVGQVNQPYGLAYDEAKDTLYVTDTLNNRIQAATQASTTPVFTIFAGATAGTVVGKFNQPVGIAVSADSNNIYVSDTSNNRIQVYSVSGGTWSVFAGATAGTVIGKVNQPHGIYVDNMGRVYVADRGNNRIQMYVANNNERTQMVGETGIWSVFMGPGTVVGTVNAPCGVVYATSGNVFVGDTLNNRIQKKPVSGGTATVVCSPGLAIGQSNQPTGMR